MERREFIKILGTGAATAALAGCGLKDPSQSSQGKEASDANHPSGGAMTYRDNPTSGDHVSLLGYGMMRLPDKPQKTTSGGTPAPEEIDQAEVNRLVKYALDHGVNYFDTSPAYCRGESERSTGEALVASGYPRDKYYIATKLSNFSPEQWSFKEGVKMFENSLQYLQTDYLDYLLLHGVGMGGMEALNSRYIENGLLDYLLQKREEGVIRNLGFSYHGDVEVFDYLLENQDKYKWDFVQIQMNYVDWHLADETNSRNTDAEYLYGELDKRGIPVVIMEPLLGGRLVKMPNHIVATLKQKRPDDSVASWAFRYSGSKPRVLTVLSGMTYMEHLQDNVRTFSPLDPLTEEEQTWLETEVANLYVSYPTIPCNNCNYCMPCPYGLDIPAILLHYNKCVNEGNVVEIDDEEEVTDDGLKKYRKARRAFLIGYDRSVPRLRQASHCIGCGRCVEHCPQRINIPRELQRIDNFVEELKRKV